VQENDGFLHKKPGNEVCFRAFAIRGDSSRKMRKTSTVVAFVMAEHGKMQQRGAFRVLTPASVRML
jgi:hypothetical protein